jgi:hypothetical protein
MSYTLNCKPKTTKVEKPRKDGENLEWLMMSKHGPSDPGYTRLFLKYYSLSMD